MSARCQWCDAVLVWAETENGRRMPLNAGPDPDGNVVPIGHDGRNMLVKVVGNPVELAAYPAGKPRYKAHFATCTNPGRFRRQKLATSNRGNR